MSRSEPAPAGFLSVDKPAGVTSHDVVGWARRALGTREIGHTGTLDPFATGVLVLCVGEATKLASYVMAGEKTYETVVRLGIETDTLDGTGQPIAEAPVPALDEATLEATIARFVGTYDQIPPAYSAIKKDGVALYERARRGEDVQPEPRRVRCTAIERLGHLGHDLSLRLTCDAGYYVRSFGRDLGLALGTRGHLTALRRTRSGRHDAASALDGELLRRARAEHELLASVRAALTLLGPTSSPLPFLPVSSDVAAALRTGKRPAFPEAAVGTYVASEGELPIAIVEADGAALRVVRGFAH